MYERAVGMGFSDIEGFPSCPEHPGGGVQKCFTSNPADVVAAISMDCLSLREPCVTTSGNAGTKHCCPSGPPGFVLDKRCYREVVPRASMASDSERALWDIQKRLCELGVDSGRVDGQPMSASLGPALRAYQARQGLPQTGRADPGTLRAMGFHAQRALEISGLATRTPAGRGAPGMGASWMLLLGFMGAAGLLYFAWKGKS